MKCNCNYAIWAKAGFDEHREWCLTQSPSAIAKEPYIEGTLRERLDASTKEMRDAMRNAYCTFKVGDIVTGKDRKYMRSIYEVLSIENYPIIDAALVSYDGEVAKTNIEEHLKKTGVTITNSFCLMIYQYRLATQIEIEESARGTKCECGNPSNPVGQGHSDWCKLFKKEF